jgi:hypothetical protein
MSRFKAAFTVGVLAYVAAWFLPVVKDGTTLLEGGLPGWEALRVALAPIIMNDNITYDKWWGGALSVLSGLSNLLLLSAVFLLRGRQRAVPPLLAPALLSVAILNTHWFVLNSDRGDLRVGYYLWMLSFFLVALAARSRPRTGEESSTQESGS